MMPKIPSIVTTNLVLNLDAGNTSSYSGSGTTWTDISGNSNNGTLINGPTFNSGNGGSIVFDGTNDYVNIPNATTLNPVNNFTLSCWVNVTSLASPFLGIIDKYAFTTLNTGYNIDIPNGGGGKPTSRFRFINSTNTYYEAIATNTLSIGSWYNVVGVYDSSNIYLYVNNSLESTTACTGNNTSSSDPIRLAGDGISTNYTPCKISNTMLYNRALSVSEISQNFNALKNRYGL